MKFIQLFMHFKKIILHTNVSRCHTMRFSNQMEVKMLSFGLHKRKSVRTIMLYQLTSILHLPTSRGWHLVSQWASASFWFSIFAYNWPFWAMEHPFFQVCESKLLVFLHVYTFRTFPIKNKLIPVVVVVARKCVNLSPTNII